MERLVEMVREELTSNARQRLAEALSHVDDPEWIKMNARTRLKKAAAAYRAGVDDPSRPPVSHLHAELEAAAIAYDADNWTEARDRAYSGQGEFSDQ